MSEQVFRFKHVRQGKPVLESELPKLPPRALRVILQKLAALDGKASKYSFRELDAEIGIELTWMVLHRLDPAVTLADVTDDEDYTVVDECFKCIKKQNPAIFPEASDSAPVVDDAPNS